MAFDFNKDPVRLFGIWPQTPFPVEVSIYGYCSVSCSFCFANLNRDAFDRDPNPVNSTASALRKLDREWDDEYSPIGFFLRNRYPVCFSNTTDPFQRDEKTYRASEAFLSWCKERKVPVYIQTRGNVLSSDFDRYAPLLEPGRVVVAMSLCQLDDKLRKRFEPGAQSIESRWELAARLTDHGIPVVMACNPYVKAWVPSPVEYCKRAAAVGAKGVWLERLHFSAAQFGQVRETYHDELYPAANVNPGYFIRDLKEWYKATADYGLDFFPTPYWDAYFGCASKHPECADPKWLGGNTFDVAFQFTSMLEDTARENAGKKLVVTWDDFKATLEHLGVPDQELDMSEFWGPFNSKVKADHKEYRARLGKRNGLHEILRYYWNHPWHNNYLFWYLPYVQAVSTSDGNWLADEDGNLVGVRNPDIKWNGSRDFPEAGLEDALLFNLREVLSKMDD